MVVVQSSKIHDNMIIMKLWDGAIALEKEVELFKWKQYESKVILLTVRWYLKYSLSYRDLVNIMKERGLDIAHTTIMRWVHQFGPELDKRIRPYYIEQRNSIIHRESYHDSDLKKLELYYLPSTEELIDEGEKRYVYFRKRIVKEIVNKKERKFNEFINFTHLEILKIYMMI